MISLKCWKDFDKEHSNNKSYLVKFLQLLSDKFRLCRPKWVELLFQDLSMRQRFCHLQRLQLIPHWCHGSILCEILKILSLRHNTITLFVLFIISRFSACVKLDDIEASPFNFNTLLLCQNCLHLTFPLHKITIPGELLDIALWTHDTHFTNLPFCPTIGANCCEFEQ